jgi:NADPH2 dehydrogenase
MSTGRLHKPLRVGHCELAHRMIMAPLTRFRATDEYVPTVPLSATYYEQRACVPGTLLISEATYISPRAGGYANVPGIHDEDQIEAWKKITAAVHAKGSFIYLQLWSLGRVASKKVLSPLGHQIVSSSAKAVDEKAEVPHALTVEEIKGCVQDYADAARNAIKAGFDGVEIHGANGWVYLSPLVEGNADDVQVSN